MKLKLLVAVAVVTALGAVVGTIWVGSGVREDTVVAHPYEQGLQYDADRRAAQQGAAPRPGGCDLAAGPCTLPAGDGLEVTLALAPRPPRTMAALTVEASLRRAGAPAEAAAVGLDLAMAGMDMGPNHVALQPAGPGRWTGQAVLVECPSGRKDWDLSVTVERAGAPAARAVFRAVVAE
ncbi:MAG: hypothetical protein QM767_07540 [Anaeromyxobacter sp.]